MKQLVQYLKTGETSVIEVPIPKTQAGMVLVKTAASLVSPGTERMVVEFAGKNLLGKARSRPDLVRQVLEKARREGIVTTVAAALNRLDQPMPLGYSSAGTVVAVGEGVEGYKAGDRVACAGGGYAVHAEYTVVPVNLIAKIPDQLEFESAAFATLGAVALHGFRLAEPQIGEKVAVIGLGLLGMLAAGIARAAGCQVIGVDLNPKRVALAAQLGIEASPRDQAEDAVMSFSSGTGVDAVLICADTSSNDPVELAGDIARDRAKIVAIGAVGLELPRKVYYAKELNFINSRSYGPGRYDPAYEEGGQDYPIGYVRWTEGRNIAAVVALMAGGSLQVNPLITHRFAILEAPQAYDLISGKLDETFLGVVLTYPGEDGVETTTSQQAQIPGFKVTSAPLPPKSKAISTVSLGLIGAGNFATAVLLPAIHKLKDLELVGVTSGSGLSAAHAARKFSFKYAADQVEQILSDADINTVAILTRHDLHAELVCAGLRAGKHVFVEKPLALNIEQLAMISSQLSQPGSPLLMVGFNRRFAPLAGQLATFIRERTEPMVIHYRVNAGYLPQAHWLHDVNSGGGRIIGEGCHFVDFLAYLVGDPPVSVRAFGIPDVGKYREDNVLLVFDFPDGSVGTVHYLANGDKSFPKERVEVFTSGWVAILNDFRSLELIRGGRRKVVRSYLKQDKGHKAEWEAFIEAIIHGLEPPIPYQHLLEVSRATLAALESLRSAEHIQL